MRGGSGTTPSGAPFVGYATLDDLREAQSIRERVDIVGPPAFRLTECTDGETVLTTRTKRVDDAEATDWRSWSDTSEVHTTTDMTQAMLNHDGLVYRHGGRR